MRVSQKITVDEIKQWNDSDIITISAPCGSGKSHFIKNTLYNIAREQNKKILFLIHRTSCVNQFQKEIADDDASKLDWIDIKTYQSLESKSKAKNPINLDDYGYIVADEFHYFMSDGAFNGYTDLSLNQILASSQIKIFMSATGDYMLGYLKHKEYKSTHYSLPVDYSFIKHLEFFHKDATIHDYIQSAIENNIKVIFFFRSAKKAYELYKMYSDYSMFVCSESNENYSQYVDREKVNNLLTQEKFDDLFLFTTTCLDAGVNIKDAELFHVVIDIGLDINQIIQCIGRKRLAENEKIFVYIKTVSNQQLGGNETQLNKKIEMAKFFRKHGATAYVDKYQRDYDKSGIVYNDIENESVTMKLNELAYFSSKAQLLEIKQAKEFGEWAFCGYVASKLQQENYNIAEDEVKMNELEIYLNSLIGKRLYKDERAELIETIGLKDARGRLQKSISQLNAYFEANNMNFKIISDKDSRRILSDGEPNLHRNKAYWELLNK